MPSSRFPHSFETNALSAALAARRAAKASLIDLTLSNPTQAGFTYDAGLLLALTAPGALHYEPRPFGLDVAREAVASDYARRGLDVDPSRVVLTASTSEAYGYLFKLLCDPGDEVLVPVPSYPLFEHLAALERVNLVRYPLEYVRHMDKRDEDSSSILPRGSSEEFWSIDVDTLRERITARTRAVLVVTPNNPTGSILGRPDLDALAWCCASHGLALVGDEVFADYPIDPAGNRTRSVLEQGDALTFSLGGLSKTAALPQLKLGWIAAGGPDPIVTKALSRLELICDTYLSVNTPVQHAAPALLAGGDRVRQQISERLRRNDARLRQAAVDYPACQVLRTEAGWYSVVRVPAVRSEEDLVVELVNEDGVLVHPGYFFDFPHEAFLIVSLLAPQREFDAGIGRMFERAHV